jgi:tetratricopeptide (TPR) repeat protein
LTAERDNSLAIATGALGEHADLACLLADALRIFQQVLPHSLDWTPIAEAGLRTAREVACPELTAAMHLAIGVAYSGIGNFGRAVAHLRLAYEIYLALGKTRERAHICLVLSTYEQAIGDLRAARAHCAESLRLRQRMGNAPGRTSSLLFLADIEAELGLYANAERKALAALALGRECGYTAGVAGALGILGRAALDRRRLDDANRHFTEQLAVAEHHAFGSRMAIALVGLARVRLHAGLHEEATRFADAAAATARGGGNAAAYVDALNVAGAAHLASSRYRDAVSCHRKAADRDVLGSRGGLVSYVRLYRARAQR